MRTKEVSREGVGSLREREMLDHNGTTTLKRRESPQLHSTPQRKISPTRKGYGGQKRRENHPFFSAGLAQSPPLDGSPAALRHRNAAAGHTHTTVATRLRERRGKNKRKIAKGVEALQVHHS